MKQCFNIVEFDTAVSLCVCCMHPLHPVHFFFLSKHPYKVFPTSPVNFKTSLDSDRVMVLVTFFVVVVVKAIKY